jgi:hypothetical protein
MEDRKKERVERRKRAENGQKGGEEVVKNDCESRKDEQTHRRIRCIEREEVGED